MLLMSPDLRIVELFSGKYHPKDLAKFVSLVFLIQNVSFCLLPLWAVGRKEKGKPVLRLDGGEVQHPAVTVTMGSARDRIARKRRRAELKVKP